MHIPDLGREVEVGRDESVLDALEEAGIEVISDCRKGECGLCTLKVLDVEGELDHRDVFLSQAQQQRNDVFCACVSRVAGTAGASVTIARP